MPVGLPLRSFVAKLPRVAMTVGWISAICFHRYGWHASISFGIGSRFPGGRDLSTLAILFGAWGLADEHQLGVRIARAEDGLRARFGKRAEGAIRNLAIESYQP